MERVVHKQLYDFLVKEKLLSPYQCGSRATVTDLAALSFTDSIWISMDQGLLTGLVFIDMQKAFKIVDHDLLTDRQQVVTVQTTLSDPCDVAFAVPHWAMFISC